MTKKRANGLKIDHQNLSNLSNRKKKCEVKNWTEPQGPMGQYQKFTFVASDSQKELRKSVEQKKYLKTYWLKIPDWAKNKLTDSRSSVNRKQDKVKEILTQTHQNQTPENQRKRKHLESSQGEK